MKTIVTGGAGFIGSHIGDALIAAGHDLLVVDNLCTGHRHNIPNGAEFAEVDISEPKVESIIAEFAPDAVFHHAAQLDVRRSVSDPVYDAQINVLGTVRVAQAAARAGCKLMTFSSSGGAMYGEQEVYPAPESHPTRSESPYGVAKMVGEQYLNYFARSAGMRVVNLRYANVYGPRQDPHGEAGVVAIFAGMTLANKTPTIFGDGEQTRDYVFVGDVVRANIIALTNTVIQGAYNIGTGVETSVNEIAHHIASAAKFTIPFNYAAARKGEQQRSVLDATKALKEMGWQAETPLDKGLQETVDWFRNKK